MPPWKIKITRWIVLFVHLLEIKAWGLVEVPELLIGNLFVCLLANLCCDCCREADQQQGEHAGHGGHGGHCGHGGHGGVQAGTEKQIMGHRLYRHSMGIKYGWMEMIWFWWRTIEFEPVLVLLSTGWSIARQVVGEALLMVMSGHWACSGSEQLYNCHVITVDT